jgi:fermentation-respiration switch protein FrsA (DUF1100 family)
MARRRDISFDSDGTTLRGWFYPAVGASGTAPTIVMSHGFSAVKEMYLDSYAELFSDGGLNALVYDNRNFGDSDGTPRQEIEPWEQVRDYRTAITYATTLAETDVNRIGVWGSSYSGGHVLVVAAIDRRVKAVVSQVPLISGYDNVRALVRSDFLDVYRDGFDAERLSRFQGNAPTMVPVVAEDPMVPSALPTADSFQWFTETGAGRAPNWKNEVTMRTIEALGEYNPVDYIAQISPTPLLLMPARNDTLTPSRFAIAAYEKALEPKKLEILPGGHFDAYVKGFEASSHPALQWFLAHLAP